MGVPQAVRGYVVCQDMPKAERSAGGIILPESAQRFARFCRVVSIDENGWLDGPKPQCKPGDVVLVEHKQHHIRRTHGIDCGSMREVDDQTYRFVPCQEIIAILEVEDASAR